MSKMQRFDFREATYFLNDCVTLDELYDDVLIAMHFLSAPKRYLSKKKRIEVWQALLSCADFLATITPKEKGGRREEV